MVYCCRFLSCVHIYDTLYYFLCYVYVFVYLQCSYTFLLHIGLFHECVTNILLVSLDV
jgi:hypothetical protein